MLPFLVLLVFVAVLVCLEGYRNRRFWTQRGVPAVPARWLFGNYRDILLGWKHISTGFQEMYKWHPTARYVGYLKMRQPCVLVRDPELVRTILAAEFPSFAYNDFKVDADVDPFFSRNPLAQNGEEWRRGRRHVLPSVTTAKVKQYVPAMATVADNMVAHVRRLATSGAVELETKALCGAFTTDVIGSAVLGVDTNTFSDPTNPLASVTTTMFQSSLLDHIKVMSVVFFPRLSRFLKVRFASKETERILHDFSRTMLESRRTEREKYDPEYDFFANMLHHMETDTTGEYTETFVAAQCFELLLDGYETSSDLICFTLFELAWQPMLQERVRQEVLSVAGDSPLTYRDLSKLKYLDMVIAETLRLHPPSMTMRKVCTRQATLPPAVPGAPPLTVEPGTPVSVAVYAMHMDPDVFSDPEHFDPERFLPERVKMRHHYAYLPFGEGPRKCPGIKLAQTQVKLCIASLVRAVRILPSKRTAYPLQVDPKIVLKRPLNGAWLRLEPLPPVCSTLSPPCADQECIHRTTHTSRGL